MKTKLKLNELKINSFVTALPNGHKVTLEGGTSAVAAVPIAPVASAALSIAASVVGAAAGLAWLVTTVLREQPPPPIPIEDINVETGFWDCELGNLVKKIVEEEIPRITPIDPCSGPNC